MFHATNHDAISTAGVDSVGTVPVSMLTYASIVSLHPDLIINAGTAGGFQVSRCYLHCQTLCG
jgi:nucleoside phosphorylase